MSAPPPMPNSPARMPVIKPATTISPASRSSSPAGTPKIMSKDHAGLSRHGRRRPLHLDAVAGAHIRPVIPDRLVVGTAIIPERDRMRAPAEAEHPFVAGAMVIEEFQNAVALLARQLVDMRGEVRVHIDQLLAAHGMARDHRMDRDRRSRPEHPRPVVRRGQPFEI